MRWAWLVWVVACSPQQHVAPATEPFVHASRPAPHPAPTRQAPLVDPPAVELEAVDVSVEPADEHWPVITVPTVAPHGALTAMFSATEPWTALCAARKDPHGVDRDEALHYLLAWCGLRDGDLDRGIVRLAALAHARSPGIATAARTDLVDLLAAHDMTAGRALAWLTHERLDEPAMIDAVVGMYIARDRRDDARAMVSTWRDRIVEPPSHTCHRLFREFMLVEGPRLNGLDDELDRLAGTDVTCRRLSQQIGCSLALAPWRRSATCPRATCAIAAIRTELARCSVVLAERPALATRVYQAGARVNWPRGETTVDGWLDLARFTAHGPGTDEVVLAALENAMRVSDCAGELPRIVDVTRRLLPVPPPGLADRVARLLAVTPAECTRARGPIRS
jgi:hypothetical protein